MEITQFHQPQIDPFHIPKKVGVYNVHSHYLPNDYYVDWTPQRWREAIDQAMNYSDLTLLDTLYSWCVESSPFLVSQIFKRITPMTKRRYAFRDKSNGSQDEILNRLVINTRWFESLKKEWILGGFYGTKVIGLDIWNDKLVDFPMRNLDIVNRGIRRMTMQPDQIVNVDEYDNLLWIQPDSSQDFRLGMLMPISRAIIGMVESFNLWNVANKQYSYPKMTVGYIDNNKEMEAIAGEIALRANDPTMVPTIPFRNNLQDTANHYQIELKPIQTQQYPDAFRSYKEYISEYRSEIMQLVTGGTLLGATEKNTNSEQLASIHMSLYEDICASDSRGFLDFLNKEGNLQKIARLYGIPRIADLEVYEIPDETMTLQEFTQISDSLARMGMRMTPEAISMIGIDPKYIDTTINHTSWVAEVQTEASLSSRIKSLFGGNR